MWCARWRVGYVVMIRVLSWLVHNVLVVCFVVSGLCCWLPRFYMLRNAWACDESAEALFDLVRWIPVRMPQRHPFVCALAAPPASALV